MGIAFVRWEYENLYQGVQICLEQKESVYDIWKCLYDYLGLISNKPEQLNLTQNIYDSVNSYKIENRNASWEEDIVPFSGSLAKCYLESQDYQKARDIYQNTLDLIPKFDTIEDSQKKSYLAAANHQLGTILQNLREYESSKQYYNQAIRIYKEIGDRYEQAGTYHQLGRVAQELRQYQQAKDYYQQALDIFIEYGDRFSSARTYHQLGIVAQELRQYQQAKDYYQQALDIKIEYGDRFSSARTYHQLGIVAQELRQYQQAKDYYQQALDIKIEYGDRFSQASTYFQLGKVAEKLENLEQAKTYYLKDLECTVESNDENGLGLTMRNLAQFYQKTQENSLLTEVAAIFNITEAEVRELFDRFKP